MIAMLVASPMLGSFVFACLQFTVHFVHGSDRGQLLLSFLQKWHSAVGTKVYTLDPTIILLPK